MPRINSYDNNTNTYVLDPLFADETEKSEQVQLYHLITLDLPEGEQPFMIVDANHDVTFDWSGVPETKDACTYTRFPVKFSPAEINADGSIAKASIAIANVSREIMHYVELYNGLRGCRVHIRTVYANALYYLYQFGADGSVTELPNGGGNPAACLHDEYFIDNYTATETAVTFQLDPIIDLEIRIPRRRFMVDSCYWIYGDMETCGHVRSSDTDTCNKTLAACRLKFNEARFGGFPGISGSRKIFL